MSITNTTSTRKLLRPDLHLARQSLEYFYQNVIKELESKLQIELTNSVKQTMYNSRMPLSMHLDYLCANPISEEKPYSNVMSFDGQEIFNFLFGKKVFETYKEKPNSIILSIMNSHYKKLYDNVTEGDEKNLDNIKNIQNLVNSNVAVGSFYFYLLSCPKLYANFIIDSWVYQYSSSLEGAISELKVQLLNGNLGYILNVSVYLTKIAVMKSGTELNAFLTHNDINFKADLLFKIFNHFDYFSSEYITMHNPCVNNTGSSIADFQFLKVTFDLDKLEITNPLRQFKDYHINSFDLIEHQLSSDNPTRVGLLGFNPGDRVKITQNNSFDAIKTIYFNNSLQNDNPLLKQSYSKIDGYSKNALFLKEYTFSDINNSPFKNFVYNNLCTGHQFGTVSAGFELSLTLQSSAPSVSNFKTINFEGGIFCNIFVAIDGASKLKTANSTSNVVSVLRLSWYEISYSTFFDEDPGMPKLTTNITGRNGFKTVLNGPLALGFFKKDGSRVLSVTDGGFKNKQISKTSRPGTSHSSVNSDPAYNLLFSPRIGDWCVFSSPTSEKRSQDVGFLSKNPIVENQTIVEKILCKNTQVTISRFKEMTSQNKYKTVTGDLFNNCRPLLVDDVKELFKQAKVNMNQDNG